MKKIKDEKWYKERIEDANNIIAIQECEFGKRSEFEKELFRKFCCEKIISKEYSEKLYEYYYKIGKVDGKGYRTLLQTI